MKRTILISLLFFTFSFCFAQPNSDTSKHLTFKGVPIDGKLADFVSKMKEAGFNFKETKEGLSILEGDFASYINCKIGVSTLSQKDLVNKIVVMFQNRETWYSLSSNYFDLKTLLTEKYGKPIENVENFQTYTPDDDGYKMTQVHLGTCKYYSYFKTSKGNIQLSIEYNFKLRGHVELVYLDKINGDTIKKQALDDL
ncbi:MAG: hypothetical protein CFE25_14000 [Chitinophagaceae bacterium BSSC1]|nr:MAG: hypothetical protein CFE25_14000 [Chitinophagaceae bacterium BSSC1]